MAAHPQEAYRASGRRSRQKASGEFAKAMPDGGYDYDRDKANRRDRGWL